MGSISKRIQAWDVKLCHHAQLAAHSKTARNRMIVSYFCLARCRNIFQSTVRQFIQECRSRWLKDWFVVLSMFLSSDRYCGYTKSYTALMWDVYIVQTQNAKSKCPIHWEGTNFPRSVWEGVFKHLMQGSEHQECSWSTCFSHVTLSRYSRGKAASRM